MNTQLVHIVTIEDPIEFLLRDNQGSITQREVGTDTPSFPAALRNVFLTELAIDVSSNGFWREA